MPTENWRVPEPKTISVAAATSSASTELAAFDACLAKTGVANYNLLYLSSVIPAGSRVVHGVPRLSGQWGDRLYCVMAQSRTSRPGAEAWAGLGWVQESSDGRGLFAEAMGSSADVVRDDLVSTLKDMTTLRPAHDWSAPQIELVGAVCTSAPICAIVVATYETQGWVQTVAEQ